MLAEIVAAVPIWVPPLFILLVVLGLKARHRRVVPVTLIYGIPLLSILSLRALAALPAGGWIWAAFAAAFLPGIWWGRHLHSRYLIARRGDRVEVAGEWMTFSLLMAVFTGNFVLRVLAVSAPVMLEDVTLQTLFCVLLGLVSGVFVGRAYHVWGAGRDTPA